VKPTKDLFELIKSLSVSEKRYFKMFASLQEGNKIYIRLFNEIDKQDSYDEKKIKEKFKDEKFIKQLSFTKNYLYKLIFKSLLNYNHEVSIDSKISEMILRCKILFSKALYRQYFKTLKSVTELADKYERYGYLIQILEMGKLVKKKDELKNSPYDEYYSAAMETLEKIKNNFEYSKLLAYTFNIARDKGKIRNPVQLEELEEILNLEHSQTGKKIITKRAEETYFHLKSLISEVSGDYESKLENLKQRYNIVLENPEPFEDNILNYKADILSEMITVCIKLQKFEETECYLKKFEDIQKPDSNDEAAVFVPAFSRLLISISKKDFKNVTGTINLLEKALIDYKDKIDISFELEVHFNIIKAYMLSGDFNNALIKMNYFFSHPLLHVRSDLECFARIMNLIIHYELNNIALLEHLIVSTYRYLYKRNKIFKIESLLLNFLRKTTLITNESELTEHLAILRNSLLKLKQDNFEKNAFEYFDFALWIEDKG